MTRSGLLFAWLVLAFAAGLLTAESLVPGTALLPLMPDDFPTWREGRAEDAELVRHPHPNWTMSDVDHLLIPGLATTRAALERGELPLWDPSQALGVPHLSEVHYSVFYPPAWIPLIVGMKGLGLVALIHLLVAGGGMLVYLRALRRSATAALTGALAFALSAWLTARLHSFPAAGAAVWLPWVLWGLERGATHGRLRSYLAAGVALALSFLAGFPQVSLLVAATAGFLELARMLVRPRTALRTGSASLAAVVLALLVASAQLLPTWEYMRGDSARAELDPATLATQTLEWPLLCHLVAPDYLASAGLTGFHPLALEHVTAAALPAAVNRAEVSMGIGVLGLLLAILAMLFGRTWSTRAWTLLVLLIFALLLSPTFLVATARLVPVLRYGDPRRLLLIATAGLSVLAAGGVDVLSRHRLRVTVVSWAVALASTAWTVMLLIRVPSAATGEDVDGWAVNLARSFGMDGARPSDVYEGVPIPIESFQHVASKSATSALIALSVSLACVILFRPRSERSERGWTSLARKAPDALALVVAVELILSAFPLLRAAPVAGAIKDPYSLELPEPPVAAALHELLGERVVPPRIARFGNEQPWLRPNLPGPFGLLDLQAYAPMVPRRTHELLATVAPSMAISGSHVGGFTTLEELGSPLFDILGVDAVLTADAAVQAEGFTEVASVGAIRILVNDDAHPHAWFASHAHVSPPRGRRPGTWVKFNPSFDPVNQVALEEEPPPGPIPAGIVDVPEGQAFGARVAKFQEWAPGSMTIDLGAGPAGLLVVSESYHGDWRAWVDGEPAPLMVANHAIMAVPIGEGGTARVDLRYQTSRPLYGALAGAGGLLAALLLVYWTSRRARPQPLLTEPE